MNAAQHQNPLTSDNAVASEQSSRIETALSAMADGEIEASELGTLLSSLETEALSHWHAYEVIGDVLRGHSDPIGATPATEFLAAVRTGIAADGSTLNSVPRTSVEAVAVAPLPARHEAANDAVFRWKLVAGFASLAAVMSVSWSLVSGPVTGGAAGAQLASSAPATLATVAAPAVGVPVAVNTGQGVVIRDAQLEALLAEHRQHGGMSALQMPSGFIRNATYEAAGR